MDQTFPEWDHSLKILESQVTQRWPDVEAHCKDHVLWAQLRDMSGSLDLRVDRSAGSAMVPWVSIGSSGALPADPSQAQAKMNDMQRVLDVLHYLNRACAGTRVFPEGSCPCSHCSGKGTARSGKCETCDGKGVR